MRTVVLSANNKLRFTDADFVTIEESPRRALLLWRRRAGRKPDLVGAFESWTFAFPERQPTTQISVQEAAELLDLALKDCDPDVWPRMRMLVMKMTDALRQIRHSGEQEK